MQTFRLSIGTCGTVFVTDIRSIVLWLFCLDV